MHKALAAIAAILLVNFMGGSDALCAEVPPTSAATGFQVLPDIKGVVSWKTLGRVEEMKVDHRMMPKFSSEIAALDGKEIRLQGFMLPLEAGKKQKRFLLSGNVPSCPFCLPGGPESLAEIHCREAISFKLEPIIISGRLAVLKDDPSGFWYRITDAALVVDQK